MAALDYVDALQEALAGEHAAVYAYGVLGGRLDAGTAPQRRSASSYDLHVSRRDQLTEQVSEAGVVPVEAHAAYALPVEVVDPATARRVATRVERRCGVLYAALVSVAEPDERSFGLDALLSSSTQLLAWGGNASALPGVGGG